MLDKSQKERKLIIMSKKPQTLTHYVPKTLIIGFHTPYNPVSNIQGYYDEFMSLIKTNGIEWHEELFMKLRTVDPAYFLTKGKLEDLIAYCDEHEIEEVIISEALSPLQERNLNNMLNAKVFDRTQLILEIFEKAAHSAEGKTQVEIAMLKHKRTRLAGKGVGMAQQKGVIGVRGGFGETTKEKEKRHIDNTILKLTRQLKQIQQNRDTQRKRRLNNRIKQTCLIGYTNAGKSSILNALTKSHTLAEDKLFATLDTTTRELYVDGEKKGVLSDTVGFIQQLPHHLIEAFKSTLSELQYADHLLHVVDVSDPNWQDHIKVVNKVLENLKVDKPILYVFNKADTLSKFDKTTFIDCQRYEPHVMTSALSKEGLAPLLSYMSEW